MPDENSPSASTDATLSEAMKNALVVAAPGLVWAPRLSTIGALISRGLATSAWRHTPAGLEERARVIAEREHMLEAAEAYWDDVQTRGYQ